MFVYWSIVVIVFVGGVLLGYLISRYLMQDDLDTIKGGVLHCDLSQKEGPSFYLELHKTPGEVMANRYLLLVTQIDEEPTPK